MNPPDLICAEEISFAIITVRTELGST